MRRLRSLPRRNLYATLSVLAVLAISGPIANAALNGDGDKPPARSLQHAVGKALTAPAPAGVSAKIKFTNELLPAGTLPEGTASPLVSGADGRIWLTRDGRFRLELQSRAGDAQIVSDGKKLTVYDETSNTVYELPFRGKPTGRHGAPDPAEMLGGGFSEALGTFMSTFTISDPPARGTVAGRPSYTVRIAPKDDGGLLGAAELAWDAERGVPLRAAVYAAGKDEPVLELEVEDISFDPVPDADVMATPPSNAKVVRLADAHRPAAGELGRGDAVSEAGSVAEIQKQLDFKLAAPAELAGLPRKQVRHLRLDGGDGALLIYGEGLGSIAVLQVPSDRNPLKNDGKLKLPQVNIDGATGEELATALGTALTFDRDGVSHVVAGLVPPVSAENAARGLR